jgi:hypothetical protein
MMLYTNPAGKEETGTANLNRPKAQQIYYFAKKRRSAMFHRHSLWKIASLLLIISLIIQPTGRSRLSKVVITPWKHGHPRLMS